MSEFLEKPADPVPGDVNAGTYLIDPAVLHGFARGEALSIERQIFPAVIADGRPVYGFVSDAYWMDLGTPEKYLQGHFDIFEGRVRPRVSGAVGAPGRQRPPARAPRAVGGGRRRRGGR